MLLRDRSARLAPGAATTFVQVLVLVAAGVALTRTGADEPDWVAFAGPTAVGLAARLGAAWLLLGCGRWLAGRDDLASFLAGRRLGLRRATSGLPLVVAAGALLGLALNTMLAAQDWEADTTAVTTGTPLVVPVEGDAAAVLTATHEADPDGRWLMAAVRVLGDDRPGSRRVFVDSERFARVVGDGLAGTPAAEGSAAVDDLAAAAADWRPEPTATGGRLTARVATDADRAALVEIAVETIGPDGAGLQSVLLRVPPGGSSTASADLTRCGSGCQVVGLDVAVGRPCASRYWAQPSCRRPRLDVDRLDLGGLDLLDRGWTLDEGDERPPGELRATPDRLRIRPSSAGRSYLAVDRSPWAVPVLSTRSVDRESAAAAPTTSGLDRPADVLGRYDALPLVGTGGTLLDLRTGLVRGSHTVASADAWVLARADTPADVLAAVGRPTTAEQLVAPALEEAGSDVAGVLVVVAAGGVAPRARRDPAARRPGTSPTCPGAGRAPAGRRPGGRPAARRTAAGPPRRGRRRAGDPRSHGGHRAGVRGRRTGAGAAAVPAAARRGPARPAAGRGPDPRPARRRGGGRMGRASVRAGQPPGGAARGGDLMLRLALDGLRSRALLSAGTLLLLVVAVGSAVLGPAFTAAVGDSYAVTRLAEARTR
ncbi:hypothetical protein [Nocardioides sp. TF02-7]|uniref:hypothetical protein n=1 Tax=Nocardioides sp. TF02-7 TaxID=2917724 RepID=UPI001F06A679|nr:hypothetical protein [Nocardioides sp. TF02-7]UMG92405.1 hypothetical protein MF408_21425 [Nocardioides sp. TF02-7]